MREETSSKGKETNKYALDERQHNEEIIFKEAGGKFAERETAAESAYFKKIVIINSLDNIFYGSYIKPESIYKI